MATGRSPPRRRGTDGRGQTAAAASTDHDRTPPIIVACTNARSALSTKVSINTKIVTALSTNTIESGIGISPSAP